MNHSQAGHSQEGHSQEGLARALESYAAALDELQPTPQLQARIQAAIASELAQRPRHARIRHWSWTVAAALAFGFVLYGLQVRQLRTVAQTEAAAAAARERHPAARGALVDGALHTPMVFPAGAVSLWPTQGTVFRVRSTLSTLGNEQQYWLDVRLANDGSMRVERVFTADGTELFVRPQ